MSMAASQRVSIDREADAGYLTFSNAPVSQSSDHGSFVVDFASDGRPVGVEVLTLTRPLDLEGVLEVLNEAAEGRDPDTEEWVRAFAAQIEDLDDQVPVVYPLSDERTKPGPGEVRFLTVPEVATIMRVSKMTVYRMVHSGVLPAIRVRRAYRVPERAVHDYLRKVTIELKAFR